MAGLGEPPFRASQLSRHFFGRYTDSPDEMTDLPRASRDALAQALLPRLLTTERELSCDDGTTRKTLWRTFDGALVESVLMRYPDRVTMCVSSQAGCGMGCPFCATGQAGLTATCPPPRSWARWWPARGCWRRARCPGVPGRVSNVVFMGMGEPLANYASVLAAVRRLTDPVPEGMGISQRSVTVSTVGLVPAITRLATEGLSVTLAVSLHAPDDELRDTLVPVNQRWKVAEVLGAAWDYAAITGRRVSIEYALIKDVNDQAWRADALGSLLAGRLAHVNLIPLNPTPGAEVNASRPAAQREFVRRLEAHGVPVTVRDTRGREIDGACGQLAAWSASVPWLGRLKPASTEPASTEPASTELASTELASGALGLGGGAARRDGDGGYAGRPAVRRVRPGTIVAFPPGSVFGERSIAIGADTLIGAFVTLSAGMVPGQDLGPAPVLLIGDRCVIGRGSHIVAHHSLVIGDDVFTGPNVYITDQNHGYDDPDVPIGRQLPTNAAVRIGSGSWLGAGAVVLPGACIGRNVVIAAGSVVRGAVPTGAWWPRPGPGGQDVSPDGGWSAPGSAAFPRRTGRRPRAVVRPARASRAVVSSAAASFVTAGRCAQYGDRLLDGRQRYGQLGPGGCPSGTGRRRPTPSPAAPRVERLGEVVDRAGRVAAEGDCSGSRVRGGQEDDRHVAGLGRLLDLRGGLEAVHARHDDVEQDDRELVV